MHSKRGLFFKSSKKQKPGKLTDDSQIKLLSFRIKNAALTLDDVCKKIYSKSDYLDLQSAHISDEIIKRKYLRLSGELISENMHSCSKILENISFDGIFDMVLTERVKKCFSEANINYSSLVVYFNESGRFFTEFYCNKNSDICEQTICKLLSKEFNCVFECSSSSSSSEIRFLAYEKPAYNVEFHIIQKKSVKSEISGDTCDSFKDEYGNIYFLISDGMSTGKEAAECSALVISLIKLLISGGIDAAQGIGIINSVIATEFGSECFSTLDIVKIDLDTGNITIYKSGAAPAILKHRNSVYKISSDSYPLGISGNAKPSIRKLCIKSGDIIVMFSDGVTENLYHIIKHEVLKNYRDATGIAEQICLAAERNSQDDISVIVAKLVN